MNKIWHQQEWEIFHKFLEYNFPINCYTYYNEKYTKIHFQWNVRILGSVDLISRFIINFFLHYNLSQLITKILISKWNSHLILILQEHNLKE